MEQQDGERMTHEDLVHWLNILLQSDLVLFLFSMQMVYRFILCLFCGERTEYGCVHTQPLSISTLPESKDSQRSKVHGTMRWRACFKIAHSKTKRSWTVNSHRIAWCFPLPMTHQSQRISS
ncbi:unnamed protein product [Ostreobium quekettii]|uniref:Uncharacterized protein n=1 Tax=Ostreobium quekettii TaxID=121088 RepID=A0A8S1IVD3_9CHLO|nr:unnamed protein product [Ostreobium quekettii]